MMRKISGRNFKAGDKIDKKIHGFEDMLTEMDKISLLENMRYALGLQFLERLEGCGDINEIEKLKLRDVIEDVNVNPK